MTGVKKKPQAGVGLIAKTFQVLDLFQADAPSWTQPELVQRTGLNRSTASRLVRYLTDTGYLVHNAATGRYSLGLASIDLGRRAMANFNLREVCQPALERMSRETDETIILTALDRANQRAICVDQIEGRQGGLRVFEKIGATFPLHAGAAPKALLAQLPQGERDAYLDGDLQQFTIHTLTGRPELEADIERTRQRGYSLSMEETYEGVAGLGGAFLGPDGYPVGSIAIALPVQRLLEDRIEIFGGMLADVTGEISEQLAGGALQ